MHNKIKHHLKRITAKDYEHRQYVILSAVIGILLLAFAFNRLILRRSIILLTIAQPGVEVTVDGAQTNLERVDENTYRLVTIPGKHTVSITADGSINHKEVIQTKAASTTAVTPALSIAPNPASSEVGTVKYIAQSKDKQYLYYLGQNGKTLVRYSIENGNKIAISDPVFRNIVDLSWESNFESVVIKDGKSNWYTFDFHKLDFINSKFINLADPSLLDIAHDPVGDKENHNRIGYIEYRDNTPVFGIATPGLDNKQVLVVLSDLKSPSFVWSPNGNSVALLEDTRYTKNNLLIYDLATDSLVNIPTINEAVQISFSDDGTSLLVSDANKNIILYDTTARQSKEIGQLTAVGAATWLDNNTILAVIEEDGRKGIVEMDKEGNIGRIYSNSPELSSEVGAFFTDSKNKVLLFTIDSSLYTFPLIEQSP